MDDPPTFSIVVPSYNRPLALAECLEALAGLDLPRQTFEVIVVDDGGTVPLRPVLARFRERMDVRLIRQPNTGPAGARNAGTGHARGEFLAFTDDDCAPAPGWLSALAGPLAEGPGRMVGGRVVNALTDNPCSSASQWIVDVVYRHYNADRTRAQFFATNNLAVPADRFRALGGFDESFRTSEDRDLCDRWLRGGGSLIYEPQAVVYHRHDLTMCDFWRQHVGYGRGAFRYGRAHARRCGGASTISPGFYFAAVRELVRAVQKRPGGGVWQLVALLVIWQVANAVGFAAEAARSLFAAAPAQRG